MNLVFEINHPAQAHLFKYVIKQLQASSNMITVLIKDSRIVKDILAYNSIDFIVLGKKGSSLFLKGITQLSHLNKIYHLHQQHRYDLGIGVSVSLALLSKISGIQSIILDDDDKAATPLFAALAHPFAGALMRPQALSHEGSKKNTVYYAGYHELSYLHPAVFTPDRLVLDEQGLSGTESFFLIRAVALRAHHDKGICGISKSNLQQIVSQLRPKGRVIITTETGDDLPDGAEKVNINPARIHHLMAFSNMVISDGQTMCSEASCLGVPSVRINDFVGRISYLAEQEQKWQLTFGFKPDDFLAAQRKIEELLEMPATIFTSRRDAMIANSINLSSFLVWFIQNYPESWKIMKKDPGYQYRFQ
jgi:uncharacterized protein